MITRVQVKNFRSLADVDVHLGPLTVLVGRNGAGKSNFVDVLRFVCDALRFNLDAAITTRHGVKALRRWAPRGRPYDVEIDLTVGTPDFRGEYGYVIGTGKGGDYRVKREACHAHILAPRGVRPEDSSERQAALWKVLWQVQGLQDIQDSFETRAGKWITVPRDSLSRRRSSPLPVEPTSLVLPRLSYIFSPFTSLYRFLSNMSLYTIFPNTLREPQKPSNEYPLTEHGENLASVLRELLRMHSRWLPDFRGALQRVVDDVSDVRVRQVGGYLITELKHEAQGGRSPWFELAQESDGTLRLLGLLVALYQDPPRTLIAIEEPELTLHPGALGVLSDLLRETAQRSQVLITTQSPDLIARFSADELRVVEREGGVTYIGPVADTQREAINEQLFTAGDLLRIEGLHRAPALVAGGADA